MRPNWDHYCTFQITRTQNFKNSTSDLRVLLLSIKITVSTRNRPPITACELDLLTLMSQTGTSVFQQSKRSVSMIELQSSRVTKRRSKAPNFLNTTPAKQIPRTFTSKTEEPFPASQIILQLVGLYLYVRGL